ncbi:MAG: mechanosensitive ion channel [Rhodobacteraceae bacterium]|nr:mechanosensitive ion channel [Paracoccaceae bacterium]
MSLTTTTAPAESTAITLPDPLTEEAANALMSRLSDSEVRQLLLDQLNAQAAKEETADNSAGLSDFVYHLTGGALTSVTEPIKRLPILFEEQPKAFTNFYNNLGAAGLLSMLGYIVLIFSAALAVEMLFRRFTSKWRAPPPVDPENLTLRETLGFLIQRFSSEILGVLIFIFVAAMLGDAILPDSVEPTIGLIGPYLIAFPRIAAAIGRFLCAPNNPAFRLINVTDEEAHKVVRNNFFLALFIGFSYVILPFSAMHGVPMGTTRLGFWLNLAMHIYIIALVWQFRGAMSNMMRGFSTDLTPAEEWVARAYPYFAIVVTAAIWWVINIVVSYGNFALLATAPHYKTMSVLMFMPAIDTLIRGLVRHLAPPMRGEGAVAERAHKASHRSYIRIGRVIVFGLSIVAIAGFWGMTPTTIASAGVGPRVAAALLEFLIIMSFGYFVYEVVSLYVNSKLAAEQTASGYDPDSVEVGGDGGGAGGSRLSTVLPLILGVARATIVIVFLLLGLSNIGIDTTPLLAGAGIVGLAIGFGAQKLVSDVVSGIFFLIDDAFRTGEYVEVDGTMGTVEKISIRSMQLRHHKGPVHTLPYGEIPKITNFSRDWVIMKLKFTVPFDTDPNKVKKIFKKIGQDMMQEDLFKDDFLQPFKSQGVFEIDDVGMVMRGKFMAKPGTQFMIRKEIYNRVKAAFDEAGIDFARREVRVALPGSPEANDMTDEDKAAVAAAATQAAQEMSGEAPAK